MSRRDADSCRVGKNAEVRGLRDCGPRGANHRLTPDFETIARDNGKTIGAFGYK
jgi:hypothetical protein